MRERLAWASMVVQARISSRWEKSARRAYTTHEYARRDGRPLELDLYLPDDHDGSVPILVWLHGGGWIAGHRADVAPVVMAQVDRGYAVASVSYSLAPSATWPIQVHEIKAAVRWLRAGSRDLGLNTDRLVMWGLSAGAHLASIVGLTGDRELAGDVGLADCSSAVQGVIAWYGPADLTSMGRNSIIDHDHPAAPESMLLGGSASTLPDLARQASPVHYVGPRPRPPFLLIHGTVDPIVPFQQSVRLHDALSTHGGRSTLVRVRLGTHIDLRLNTGARRRAAESFLDEITAGG